MIRNIIFLVVLSTVGIVGLTYIISPKPKSITEKKEQDLHIKNLPLEYKIIGDEKLYKKAELFNEKENFIIVANHESLAILNDIYKYIDTKKNILIVANISAMPLVLKKFAIEPTLEELMKNKKVKMIFDSNAEVINSLALYDSNPLSYFLYKIDTNGDIKKLYTGKVKAGTLDGIMTEEEKKLVLEPIEKYLK